MAQKIIDENGVGKTVYDFEGVDLQEYGEFQRHINNLMGKPVEQHILLALYHLYGPNGISDEEFKEIIFFGEGYYF